MQTWKQELLATPLILLMMMVMPSKADDASDLAALKTTSDNLKRETETLNRESSDFLNLSRELRSKDEKELAALIKAICDADIEQPGDEAETIANDLVFDAVSEIGQSFEVLEERGDELLEELEAMMNSLKSARDQSSSLTDSETVGDEAKDVLDQVKADLAVIERRWSETQMDYQTLVNIQNNVMKGSNNPRIRAAMDHGKTKHRELQSSLSCDYSEVTVSNGRADCVKFDSSAGCLVIEIKPDTYSRSDAEAQAAQYIPGLKTMYKDNAKAIEMCKMDSYGDWIFTPKAEFYSACKP